MGKVVKKGTTAVSTDFSKFESYLTHLGLPNENIIASPEERARIMTALPELIESLPADARKNSRYLSKFIAGSAVGLFDAALNFVWNEVVLSLRKKVIVYGLDIFFDAAVGENVRDQYSSEEDLAALKDRVLIDNCNKLELITDTLHKKLAHILDMRNDVGASHPTNYAINSYELLGWLQTCVKEVLHDDTSKAALTVQGIVANLKKWTTAIDQQIIDSFEVSLKEISSQMTGNLLKTLFGIYVANNTTQITRENIFRIAPVVWGFAREEAKYDLGFKVDNYRSALDQEKQTLSEAFFETCEGNKYLSLDTRIIKIGNLISDLERTHTEWDNFHYEPPIARSVMSYIESADDIPKERLEKLLTVFLICRIGREVSYNHGVSPGAKPYYDKLFKLLNTEQVILMLKLLGTTSLRNRLYTKIRSENAKEILELVKSPVLGQRLNELIEMLLKAKSLDSTFITKNYQDIAKKILV